MTLNNSKLFTYACPGACVYVYAFICIYNPGYARLATGKGGLDIYYKELYRRSKNYQK